MKLWISKTGGLTKHKVHVRHLVAHEGGQIPDFHEWYLPGRIVYRDAIGRENNGDTHSWMVLECPNPQCTGEAIVLLDDFTTGIPLGVVKPDTPEVRERYEYEKRKQQEERYG